MAKTTKQYFDGILAEKQTMSDLNSFLPTAGSSDAFLDAIDNKSKVSFWERFAWVQASCANAVDVVMDLFKIDLETISRKSRFGTDISYIAAAKAFQFGDRLIYSQNEYKYPVEVPVTDAKRIIAFAALYEVGNDLTLKVARLVSGLQQELDTAQLQAFTAYMNFQKPKGINLAVVSLPPDLMWLKLKVNYDPLVLKATGESILNPGTFPAEDAVNAYLLSINRQFNGVFENQTLIDFLQAASGVTSAYVDETKGKPDGGAYGAAFEERYVSAAGYMKIDPAHPLSGTITYTANV